MAIDEGRLRLDQNMAELLPEHVSAMTPAQQAITLKQLLTMTAGFSVDDRLASRGRSSVGVSHVPRSHRPTGARSQVA